jgi:hypothetical protein
MDEIDNAWKKVSTLTDLSKYSDDIEKEREKQNLVLPNDNNPVSSRGILILDIKGKINGKSFMKTIIDLPGREDIKNTYSKIKIKQIYANESHFVNFGFDNNKLAEYLFINPLLICFMNSVSQVLFEYYKSNKSKFIKIETFKIYNLTNKIESGKTLFCCEIKDFNKYLNGNTINSSLIFKETGVPEKYHLNYIALILMAYLITTNKFDIIEDFYRIILDVTDANKHQIKMVFQGFFINEIVIGFLDYMSKKMASSNYKTKFDQVNELNTLIMVKQTIDQFTLEGVVYNGPNTTNTSLATMEFEKSNNEIKTIIFTLQQFLAKIDTIKSGDAISKKWTDMKYLDIYDFQKRYSRANPLQKLLDKEYHDTHLNAVLMLVQNTLKDNATVYNCDKIQKQIELLVSAEPLFTN